MNIRDFPLSGAEAVSVAVSRARDAEVAVSEIAAAVAPADPSFVFTVRGVGYRMGTGR